MKQFEYFLDTERLDVSFKCPSCSAVVEEKSLVVPEPNLLGENHAESTNSNEYTATCPQCGKEFNINLYRSMFNAEGDVEELNEDSEVIIKEY